jgi:hypothetical protein
MSDDVAQQGPGVARRGRRRKRFTITAAAALLSLGTFITVQRLTRPMYVAPLLPEPVGDAAARIRRELFADLQPVRLANCELARFGEPNDGGYLLCANLLEGVAAGYSYGISGYDQWGCDVSRTRRIPVHQYDCFDLERPSCADGDTRFHEECLGARTAIDDGRRRFDTLERQFAANGYAAARVVLKMDVEAAEWDALLEAPDGVLERIDQMAIEFHGTADDRYLAAIRRLKRFFYVVHLHFNNFSCWEGLEPFPAWAYEVLLVSKRLGVVDGSSRPVRPHPLDAPNNVKAPDCQAGLKTPRRAVSSPER